MFRALCVVFALAFATAAHAGVYEYKLPGFKAAALEKDLPVADILLAGADSVWIAGKQSLWNWRLSEGRLTKIALDEAPQKLAFDGLSVFAAGKKRLFQYQVATKRLFVYQIPGAVDGNAVAFGGAGDDLWLVHARGLFAVDRYGKTLNPMKRLGFLTAGDLAAYDPAHKKLWVARGKEVSAVDLESGAEPKTILTVKRPLLGLALDAGQVVLHTAQSVLRLDAGTAKTRKSIPVQGARKLTAMAVAKDRHAYVFDDYLLEIFDVEKKTAHSFKLGIDGEEGVSRLAVAGDTAAMLVGDRVRAFRWRP